MSKSKSTSRQPSFFRRDVPKMPEGYYSSGPNPNLRQFVEEHAKPYDMAEDRYGITAFTEQITVLKRKSPAMDLHIYWSKKPHDAIREYIKHYTKPKDIVLDPFCGSGGTALAALIEDRHAIAIDLSPAATFITKNYCTPVDVDILQSAFEEIQRKVKSEMEWLYETRCDRCDGKAITAYTVYSQLFQCPRCLQKVPLYNCVEVDSQTLQGKAKKAKACPHCFERGHIEEIRSQSQKFGYVPVETSYICLEGCKPERGGRRYDDNDLKKRQYFQLYDLEKIREIEQKPIPHNYPKGYDMRGFNGYQRDALRLYGVQEVADLFTKRNLWALASLRQAITEIHDCDFLLFVMTTALLTVSRMCRHDYPSIMPGAYYIPQINRELNAWLNFSDRFPRKLSGAMGITGELVSHNLIISTQSATNFQDIRPNSIDYIFTDPPYADKIQYGELNFAWEAWLDFNTDWLDREIIVNDTRGKTELEWGRLIKQAMEECFRVLKPGRWISVCYHDTSEGTWQLLQDIMAEVGFVSEKSDTALYIDIEQKSFNQLIAEKVTKRDLVINFRKPRPEELALSTIFIGDEDDATFTEKARLILGECLNVHPGTTADRLYDDLVSRMVRRGEFQSHNFDELLRSVAEEVNGRWYLLETAGQVDEAESNKEVAAGKCLEVYMKKALSEQDNGMGLHYSELFEQYLSIKDKPRRLLQEWLPEFFFKTTEGTWRPPMNDEERSQKVALRSSGALRRIKRFANALIDGVPPVYRDKPENTVTLTDWIRQCRRAGLYDLGRALYEKGGLRFDELSEETQLQVDEDYQICVGRSKTPMKPKTKGRQLPLVED